MEHLTKAIEKLAKGYGLSLTNSFLGDVMKYIATGDEKLMSRLLKIGEADMNKLNSVARAVPRPDKFQETDRLLIRFFIRRSALLNGKISGKHYGECSDWPLARCLERHLQNEKPGEDLCGILRTEVLGAGVSESAWMLMVARHVEPKAVEGRMTSAGRYLATRPAKDLLEVMPALRYHCTDRVFMPAFAAEFPAELETVMDGLLKKGQVDEMPRGGWQAALDQDAKRFESRVAAAFNLLRDEEEKGHLVKSLQQHFPGKYRDQAIKAASNIGAGLGGEEQAATARWLIEEQGAEAVSAITDYIGKWNLKNSCIQDWKVEVLRESAKLLGRELKPALVAAMQKDLPQLRHGALELWIGLRDPADDEELKRQLFVELKADDSKQLVQFIPLAASWNISQVAPRLWELAEHKSKPVRESAAHALSHLGDTALPKANELLASHKGEVRRIAVTVLGAVGTSAAHEVLHKHLQAESSDDVRDLINKLLSKTPSPAASVQTAGSGEAPRLKPDQEQIDAAIAAAAAKMKAPPATWIHISQLPPLFFLDGNRVEEDGVRYLLYRQAREREMTAEPEAALLMALLDRKRSGDFALTILNGYLNSSLDAKDRWALALAGLLGDDRIVPILSSKVGSWAEASRGKLAEYAVQALALLGSDAALLAVDAMAIRYRTKFKNIGKTASQAFLGAADVRGISAAELGDRVVPWLGFAPSQPRVFEFGSNRIEASIGLDLKLVWRDLEKGKPVKSLPAGAPDNIKAQAKELSAGLREAAKSQLLRVENLMVQQNRWPASRWQELFLQHPLLFPFAVRLVWGAFDEAGKLITSFRSLEDRTLTDAQDSPFTLPSDCHIGIVHPLDLSGDARQTWLKHLADYNVTPPFAQLERPVIRVTAKQAKARFGDEVNEIELNAMTFKGRAERLGWSRGSVCDGGGINHYYKPFPAAGVDVFIGVEDMYVGIDMYSDITLGNIFFVKHRSVKTGSYEYDEPGDPKDPRLVVFGDVPAIAFSEAMGDLIKIAGKEQAAESATEE